MSRSIYTLRPSKANPSIPYLFINTTEVQSGRRVVISPMFLQSVAFGGADDWHWRDWLHGPPLSAAAGLSSRFPGFSPAAYLNNNIKYRYVDGGYVDNSGVVTLREIFNALYLRREQAYLERETTGDSTTKFAITTMHVGNAPTCFTVVDGKSLNDGTMIRNSG
jgi:hypothetical protein